MEFALEKELMMIGRLLIAGFCGGIIGHERENRRKPAGVRTHTVVGVASALMVMISKYMCPWNFSLSRNFIICI